MYLLSKCLVQRVDIVFVFLRNLCVLDLLDLILGLLCIFIFVVEEVIDI